jgi:hypothetical protein
VPGLASCRGLRHCDASLVRDAPIQASGHPDTLHVVDMCDIREPLPLTERASDTTVIPNTGAPEAPTSERALTAERDARCGWETGRR